MNVMAALPNKYKPTAILISTLVTLGLILSLQGKISAAAITVASGTDTIASDSTCHLSEAIQNINDQAQTNADCAAGDGNNDTINLPTGTITLSADLPSITQSITIQGQGMGVSIVDGSGAASRGIGAQAGTLRLQDMTLTQFNREGIDAENTSNLIVERVEVAHGSAPQGSSVTGISLSSPEDNNPESRTLTVKNVHLHNIIADGGATQGILVTSSDNSSSIVTIENVTINTLHASGVNGLASAITLTTYQGAPSLGLINATLNNTTIHDVIASNDAAVGLNAFSTANGGSSQVNVNANNLTLSGIDGAPSPVWGNERGSTLSAAGVAVQPGDVAVVSISSTNTLMSTESNFSACLSRDLNPLFMGAGDVDSSFTSSGGNLSDDNTCSTWFNQSTDQNNVSGLSSTLGSLSDYGGSVPTIKLLPGSPAIDNASCTGAPSTDARGITRPQGTKCDSGAYEVNQANKSTTTASSTPVTINTPQGVIVNSFAPLASSEVVQDNQDDTSYQYPLGLTSFELAVPTASTQEISLDFITNLTPDQVTARKYNTNNQTYTNLDNATITQTTVDSQPALRLTYSITDGVFPDLDGLANGTIVDPVGLAVQEASVGAPNTGIQTYWLLGVND